MRSFERSKSEFSLAGGVGIFSDTSVDTLVSVMDAVSVVSGSALSQGTVSFSGEGGISTIGLAVLFS